MKRLLILLLFVTPAFGQTVSVTANLKDIGVGNVTGNTSVTFELQNYGGQIPRISGTGVLANLKKIYKPDASGTISGTVYANSAITPVGTWYQVCIINKGVTLRCDNYLINSAWDLATATPLSVTPSVGPQQLIVQSYTCNVSVAATTWTCNHNFNDTDVWSQEFDSSGVQIYPDHVDTSNPNTETITWVSAQAGTARIMHAGSIAIATNQPNAIVSTPSGLQTIPGSLAITAGTTVTGNNTHSGTETFANIDAIQFVDGVTNTTVQAAINNLPATGGTVYIPPGTYVGPTTIPSGTRLVSLGNINPPQIWSLFNGVPFNSFTAGSGSANLVKFTYTANLTIQDKSQIDIEGVVLDFGGSFNFSLIGVSDSTFAMAVVNTGTSAPALTWKADSSFGASQDHFKWLILHGGNVGLSVGNASGQFATESVFDVVHIMASTQPSGTYTAVQFVGNCDSNLFHKIELWYTSAVTTLQGVVFNSNSATADSGADGIYIGWYDETGASFTGNSIVVNPSANNFIRTGILKGSTPMSVTAWAGNSTFQWDRMGEAFPNTAFPAKTVPVISLDAGATGAPSLFFKKAGSTKWQFFDDGSDNLIFSALGSVSLMKLTGSANLGLLGNGHYGSFAPSAFGADRTYTLPDATGTMALQGTVTLKKGSGGGNYTNATTSYTVADATNLCYTVTIPTGWKLGISASGYLSTATAAVPAQAALTDNAACSTANAGILVETAPIQGAGIGIADAFALNWVITGDGNAHNVALQFKTSNAADTASLINSSATVTPTMKFALMPSN